MRFGDNRKHSVTCKSAITHLNCFTEILTDKHEKNVNLFFHSQHVPVFLCVCVFRPQPDIQDPPNWGKLPMLPPSTTSVSRSNSSARPPPSRSALPSHPSNHLKLNDSVRYTQLFIQSVHYLQAFALICITFVFSLLVSSNLY